MRKRFRNMKNVSVYILETWIGYRTLKENPSFNSLYISEMKDLLLIGLRKKGHCVTIKRSRPDRLLNFLYCTMEEFNRLSNTALNIVVLQGVRYALIIVCCSYPTSLTYISC